MPKTDRRCGTCEHWHRIISAGDRVFGNCDVPLVVPDSVRDVERWRTMEQTKGKSCPCWKERENHDS